MNIALFWVYDLSEWLLFNTKMNNFFSLEQVTFNETEMMY